VTLDAMEVRNREESEMSEAAVNMGALTDALDADVLEELAQTFEAELARTRAALKQAALAGDRNTITREVHSLSAIFAQLGAPETGAELLEAGRNGGDAEVARLADQLEERAAPLIAAMRDAGRTG
jgi:HPt (histidine-containing phosphotransfer) domain-containing protein